MFPAQFAYAAPETIDEVLELLAAYGSDAKVLAGGCSLIPLLKLRLAEPAVLIDVRRAIAGGVRVEGDEVRIHAMTREAELEASQVVHSFVPLLWETSSVIADPVVRNMGTVGGNLAHADPANDHPAAMLALRASVVVRGPDGERRIAIEDFFRDLYETALEPGEVVMEIAIPMAVGAHGGAYEKLERQVGDFAIVGVAAHVELDDGLIRRATIALTNVATTAVRATAAEAALTGREPTQAMFAAAAAETVDGLSPWSELRGSAEYKLAVLPVIARRALERAARRAAAWSPPGDMPSAGMSPAAPSAAT